ncbi:unnamed protein product [Litomosoides sigmodontis]|uniref:Lipid-binding serum glycoprotein C-terminal domain-containing protein n=1 Tax=Litomosoides sigmodontis TaxID=42156 RepID=A0A3P6U5M3_LITSI|nr:unnamed protein product [Litomosoides sigmodontis]
MNDMLLKIALWLAISTNECLGLPGEVFIPLHSALRVRFGDDVFQQLSRIVEYLFIKHTKRVAIPPQQQCFPEGCVTIQDFSLVAHKNPSHVAVMPTPPNFLTLKISGFNFHIAGKLYGQLQPLPLLPMIVPTYGTLAISANQLVIGATFDMQKTVDNVPYIRVINCLLINEVITAQVENMGLLTAIVNAKYQHEIRTKSRVMLEETLCSTINGVVDSEMNSELLQIPSQISIAHLYRIIFESNSSEIWWRKLGSLLISLNILDTSSTYRRFFIGLDGDVYRKEYDQTNNPYQRPERLRFTEVMNGNAVDLLVSEYTINTLLLKAHIIGALVFSVSSGTPVLGKLIRTSCGIDEVCLSDIIPEAAEAYPNRQLEIILRTTKPPKAVISTGLATVMIKGRAAFFVERSTKEIGVIPFSTTIQCEITSLAHRISAQMSTLAQLAVSSMKFYLTHISGRLNSEALLGDSQIMEAAKGALMKLVNEILREGISLNESTVSRLSNTSLSLVDGAILLQAKFDIERNFYQQVPVLV